jgi:hypothetical protein
MEVGDIKTMIVSACTQWHDTKIDVEPGQQLRFSAKGHWVDMIVRTDANGYKGRLLKYKEKEKRVPELNWFALLGAVNKNDEACFLIGTSCLHTFKEAGRIYCIANDIKKPGFYTWNNWGHLALVITRVQ